MNIRLLLAFVFSLALVSIDARVARAADMPAWFNPGASNAENAKAAAAAQVKATEAVATLVQFGGDPVDSVRSAVIAYGTCSDLYDIVERGVSLAPAVAGEIAIAVVMVDPCPCKGENVWARTRLERRLRTQRNNDLVALGLGCSCIATTAEAAAAAAPAAADDIYRRLAIEGGNCECAKSAFAGVVNGLREGSAEWIKLARTAAGDAGAVCPGAVVAVSDRFSAGPIPIGPADVPGLDGAPDIDQSPVDPNRGGEIASPN